jgi:hypothetical protein
LMEGCISADWNEIRQLYHVWLGHRKTGCWWVELLISLLLGPDASWVV